MTTAFALSSAALVLPAEAATDTTAPAVASTTPDQNGYAKSSGFAYTAVASEALNQSTSKIDLFDSTNTQDGTITTSFPNSTTVKVTQSALYPLKDGAYTARITLADAAGNASVTTRSFTIDSKAPAAPTITKSGPGGTVNVINATNQGAFVVAGKGEAGTTITLTLTDSGNVLTQKSIVATTVVANDGTWLISRDVSSLADGAINYSAVDTDQAGNASASVSASGTKDTVAPAVVNFAATPATMTTPFTATLTGTVNQSSSSSTAEAGDSVTLTATDGAGTVTAVTTADGSGNFNKPIDTSTLMDGRITYTAVATDAAGNAGNAATASNTKGQFAQDAKSPERPLNNSTTSANTSVSITFNHPVSTSGANTTSTLMVTNKNNVVVACQGAGCSSSTGKQAAYADGNRTIVWTAAGAGLTDAGSPYKATYDAYDSLDASAHLTNSWTFSIDTTAPAAPTIKSVTNAINKANQAAVVVSGTGTEVGNTITVTLGGMTKGTTVPNPATGVWSVTFDATSLADGAYTASAQETDPYGNTSAAGTLDTVKDTVSPTLVSTTPAGGSTVKSAATAALTFSENLGSTPSGTVKDASGADVTGSWSVSGKTATFSPEAAFADGTYTVTANVADVAGNPGTGSFSFTVDGTAPVAPVITSVTNPVNAVNQASVVVTGTAAEPNETVNVTLGGLTAMTTADSNGAWSVTVDATSLADGSYTASATETDAAGNTSAAGTKDTVKDATAPTLTSTSPTDGSTVTSASSVSLTFSEALGTASVVVKDSANAAVAGSASVSGSTVTFTPSSALADGSYTVSASVTDTAGNPGTGSFGFAVQAVAAVPTNSSITLDALPAKVVQGTTITLKGKVTQTTSAAFGTVAITAVTGSGKAINWGNAAVASDGSYSLTIKPRYNSRYTATYAGDQANTGSASGSRSTAVAFAISAHYDAGNTSGTPKLYGGIAYAPQGVAMSIYRTDATGNWVKIGSTTADGTYHWLLKYKLAKGYSSILVVSAGATDNSAGALILRINNP